MVVLTYQTLNFPLHLTSCEDEIACLNYSLLGRVYSTSPNGGYFYSRLIKNFNENTGVYKHNGVILKSNNPISLAGEQPLTVLVGYSLNGDNSVATNYFNSKIS
jgi:hypothetical protein